ncbi:MAG: Lrp/AsnC family transcriptional regulator, partial [Nanoarchaeota archaeon]
MAKGEVLFEDLARFKKRIHINEKLNLDDRDNTILSLLQKNPAMSQKEIAEKIRLSQPSVGARIRKLEQKGILQTNTGVNFRVIDLKMAKVDVSATDTTAVIREFQDCPFFLNALILSGRFNVCLLFMATDLKRLEGIVNHHLRGNPLIKDIEMNVVISTARDLILPLNIDY